MDGFALAETTPGPLIIVVAFVGFLAGYNHFHGSLWMGTLGSAGNDLLYVPAVFFLRICGCAAGGRNPRQPDDRRRPGTDHRCRGRRNLRSNAISRESGDLPIRSCRSQATQCDLLSGVILSLFLIHRLKLKVLPLILLGIRFGSIRYFLGF